MKSDNSSPSCKVPSLQRQPPSEATGSSRIPDDLFVTNANVRVEGLHHYGEFITSEEEHHIIDFLDKGKWIKDAFSKRRRQVYNKNYDVDYGNSDEEGKEINQEEFLYRWKWLIDRVVSQVSDNNLCCPNCALDRASSINQLLVQEISGTTPSGPNILEHTYGNSFEAVYEIHLNSSPGILVSYRLPVERRNDCWNLKAENKIFVPRRCLIVNSNECLLNWRRNISSANRNDLVWKVPDEAMPEINLQRDSTFRHIVIKMRHICQGKAYLPVTHYVTGGKSKLPCFPTNVGTSLPDRLSESTNSMNYFNYDTDWFCFKFLDWIVKRSLLRPLQ